MTALGNRWLIACALLTLLLATGGCGRRDEAAESSPPREVSVSDPSAPSSPASILPGPDEIPLYREDDRQEHLIQGASRHPKISVYEGIGQEDLERLVAGFRNLYPNLQVEAYRANGEAIRERILREHQAGVYAADVIGIDFLGGEILEREGIIQPYHTPQAAVLPEKFRDPDGLWNAYRVQYFVAGYNTNRVPPEKAPRRLEDFLAPRWGGGFATEAESYDWMATLVGALGEEEGIRYFQDLSRQRPTVREGYTGLTNALAAGEVPVAFPVYNHAVQQLKDDGAPVDWVPVEPVVASPSKLVLPKHSQNPYGGLLWIDFILSEEGQQILRDRNRVPTNPAVPADPPSLSSGFEFVVMDAERILSDPDGWRRRFGDLFITQK